MRSAKSAIDPLWQCLCPSWTPHPLTRVLRLLARPKRPSGRSLNERPAKLHQRRAYSGVGAEIVGSGLSDLIETSRKQSHNGKHARGPPVGDALRPPISDAPRESIPPSELLDERWSKQWKALMQEPTPYLYTRLRVLAAEGKIAETRELAEYMLEDRREKPSVAIYTALILSNVSHDQGGAWRVIDYLEEMRAAGLQADTGTCHAVLKVLGVHPDHLVRADILEYMNSRWFQLSEEGTHDVVAGLLREGCFEQAMHRIDGMQRSGVQVQGWLLDMAVYVLCTAGEIKEAYRLQRQRHDAMEHNLSKIVWFELLDAGSSHRHLPSTAFVWNNQVGTGYINPPSGLCLNVLTTASQAGDAVLATEVFTHLSKRGAASSPILYQLLIDCYLGADPPDLKRALSILSIMALEKMPDPATADTRSLYLHLRSEPSLISKAFTTLRELHIQGRKIPIAALNLVIECYVEQKSLTEALSVYKLIHTFNPIKEGPKKSFANVETFNLLLKGCRLADPPDEGLASFLVSEMLALRVKPTALTYDRLILVFVQAGAYAVNTSQAPGIAAEEAEKQSRKGQELLDWAFRHFSDMQQVSSPSTLLEGEPTPLGWMPRFGTIERLAIQLAKVGDSRCWDVLQAGEDHRDSAGDWEAKGKWVRRNVEEAWTAHSNRQEAGKAGLLELEPAHEVAGEPPAAAAAG